ncbi:MAG TPA: DUF362 domain-containing protein [Armatimonadota bacterium]|nr:DUF362 domain-containing protein [Armatimonadota bacterium]
MINRRRFIQSTATAAAAVGAGLFPTTPVSAAGATPVAFYRHSGMPDMPEAEADAALRGLVDAVVRDVSGEPDAEAAWKALFRSDDKVAIKVNCMAGLMSPGMDLINAVVDGLKVAGVDPDRIIIFDKEDRDLIGAGYELRHEPPGPLIYGTVGGPSGPGYNPRNTTRGGSTYRVTNILTEATAIINVPVVKDHVFAGITGALKNHFGTIHNPEDFHYINNCSPAVAEVNLAPPLRSRQRLIIGDARNVQYDGGPSYHPEAIHQYSAVFGGIDPVAVDSQILALIDTLRDQNNLPIISETERPCRYLEAAAEKDIGTLDPDNIDLYYADFAEDM